MTLDFIVVEKFNIKEIQYKFCSYGSLSIDRTRGFLKKNVEPHID